MDAARCLNFCLLLATVCLTSAQQRVPPEPPSIGSGPPAEVVYYTDNVGETVELPCVATGEPKPEYEWKKNGMTYSRTPKKDGTIEFQSPDQTAEGIYQCFARNSEGVAMSNTTILILSRRAQFREADAIEKPATVGDKLQLDCSPVRQSIPSPRTTSAGDQMDYSWREDTSDEPWLLDKRSQIDDSGRLNVAVVTQEDINSGKVWTCNIRNHQLGVEVKGSKTKIVSSGQPPVPRSGPTIMFYTNQTGNPGSQSSVVVGLEERPASLRCFYSGGPDISLGWRRTDGGQLPTDGSVQLIEHNSELRFRSVKKTDEGDYACLGTNSGFPTQEFSFRFLVHAAPTFKSLEDRPKDTDASVGENVVMRCNAYAIPKATVIWFKDGEQIDPNNLPSRKFHLSDDLTTLTVSNVCKNNCSGPNDRMVLQCNASNEHGYALANGFINVYVRTNFTLRPDSIEKNPGETVSFTARATTDPNTPIRYMWYFKAENCPGEWCIVENETDYISITHNNGTTLTILDIREKDLGRYKVEASNGASTDSHEFVLNKVYIEKALVWEYWYIPFIILIIVLLILLLILCCCCYMYRNRGDEYPVDEKERQADRDPEKELADSGFHDYQRPTTQEDERRLLTG